MKPRFLADANLDQAIVEGVRRREPSIDFLTGHAAGIERMTDPEVLALAMREKRILVSHDLRTMPRHFREFVARRSGPGVFLISQALPVASAIEELLLIWTASDQSEWENQLTYLPL
ncbi:MAG: DUF5615 family PIN-like protein [Acidobacteria bacterium]|nr:DUF5615 family PIN-like protein [Acidobacteriota bacterium]